jgi:hypothetical protein
MTANKKPEPLIHRRKRQRCPVCHELSYSASGIHPQCAVRQADAIRMQHVREQAQQKRQVTRTADIAPWQKVCPKCKAVVHVRKKTCECGHAFPACRPPLASHNSRT